VSFVRFMNCCRFFFTALLLLSPEPVCQTCFFSKFSHVSQRKFNPYAFHLFTLTVSVIKTLLGKSSFNYQKLYVQQNSKKTPWWQNILSLGCSRFYLWNILE
jgi:hypothetical protein